MKKENESVIQMTLLHPFGLVDSILEGEICRIHLGKNKEKSPTIWVCPTDGEGQTTKLFYINDGSHTMNCLDRISRKINIAVSQDAEPVFQKT